MTHSKSIPIKAAGKRVGYVRDGVFTKHVRGSKHFLRIPPAIAFDIQSLYDAERAGAQVVHVHDKESGVTYRASLRAITQRGVVFDRKHGRQVYLAMNRWVRDDAPVVGQLPLFAMA